MRGLLPGLVVGALVGCAAPEPDGERTVKVLRIDVRITVEPSPETVVLEEPRWIHFHHCGVLSLEEDALLSYGALDPEVEAVALVHYPGWGGIFSGGGTEQLELYLDGPTPIHAALRADDVLYDLAIEDPDTGVPGGEQSFDYLPHDLPDGHQATEVHSRWPIVEVPIREVDPLNCAR